MVQKITRKISSYFEFFFIKNVVNEVVRCVAKNFADLCCNVVNIITKYLEKINESRLTVVRGDHYLSIFYYVNNVQIFIT